MLHSILPPAAVWMILTALILFLAGEMGEKDPRHAPDLPGALIGEMGPFHVGFKQQLCERALQESIPVLQDNVLTILFIFLNLEKEDFSARNIKLGHCLVMLQWWRSLTNKQNKETGGHENKDTMKTRSHKFDSYSSPHTTTRNWRRQKFAHCLQQYSWKEMVHCYKDMNISMFFKMGWLGKLLEANGYETRQCFCDHYCAISKNFDDSTCTFFST